MADYKRPPLEGVFQTKGDDSESLLPVKQQIENFEHKARLNFNKSRPAPQPPGQPMHLPKIGNYQPKILLRSKSEENRTATNPSNPSRDQPGMYSRHFNRSTSVDSSNSSVSNQKNDSEDRENSDTNKKYMIIGDKDTPITVHQTSEENDKTESGDNSYYSPYGTDNATFISDSKPEQNKAESEERVMLDFEEMSKRTIFDEDFEENKENFDVVNVKNNPLFGREISVEPVEHHDEIENTPRKSSKSKAAPPPPSATPPIEYPVKPTHLDTVNETEEPYIPAPDYDHDHDEYPIKQKEYAEIPGRRMSSDNQRTDVYRNFPGEDYSQYLSDDEDYFSDQTFAWRKKILYRQKGAPPAGKSRPVSHPQRPPRPKKAAQAGLKPLGKSKHDPKVENIKRNTIRDFSFSDSKIGFGDRTVKSTSAKGRYEKRNKDRPRIEGSEGSYEEFLRTRLNENGSSSSADSGHDTGDDMYTQNSVFANSQPKQVREKKGSMWQRLTWRFKRHSGYQLS